MQACVFFHDLPLLDRFSDYVGHNSQVVEGLEQVIGGPQPEASTAVSIEALLVMMITSVFG